VKIIVLVMATVILWSCAPRVTLGPAHLIYPEIRPIEIELKSFSFHPNHIAILKNQSPLTLRLNNTANLQHNFSLIDSQKNVIARRDLNPKESITFDIESPDPGNYVFYCNRCLHRFLGMEGMLMVD